MYWYVLYVFVCIVFMCLYVQEWCVLMCICNYYLYWSVRHVLVRIACVGLYVRIHFASNKMHTNPYQYIHIFTIHSNPDYNTPIFSRSTHAVLRLDCTVNAKYRRIQTHYIQIPTNNEFQRG